MSVFVGGEMLVEGSGRVAAWGRQGRRLKGEEGDVAVEAGVKMVSEGGANDQVRSGKEPQVRGSVSWARGTFSSWR